MAFVQLKWHGRRRKSSEHSEQALSGEAALRGCKTWDVREALYFVVRGLPPIDLFYFCGMLRTSGGRLNYRPGFRSAASLASIVRLSDDA